MTERSDPPELLPDLTVPMAAPRPLKSRRGVVLSWMAWTLLAGAAAVAILDSWN